ncbi:dihydrofolate reductase family protein [Desulfobotulus sp. H1]|uniref:Dihydrofolate reductase family protein n=1 Tax=Desulfobotulus pelophilus TaxID=2823377 RepID=A0ABT3NAI5_9BACT|nr:dihydrofolate reductase family protein [Desulfobotulus pelophilus]MCW7754483.1 dihydrofolate reductase family protein [Desulfobotulus pelophilus]
MAETGDRVRVILVMARTLDGRTARGPGDPLGWTERADKVHFADFTRRVGVVIMGAKTFDAMGAPLPGRKNIVFTRSPEKRAGNSPNLVFTSGPVEKVLANLADQGYREAALIGGSELNAVFARKGCIDEMMVTVSPLFFGEGPGLFAETVSMDLQLAGVKLLGENSLLLHYRVRNGG